MISHREALQVITERLSPALVRHVRQVAATAQYLAGLYQVDGEKAYLAGLLHDYAKEESAQDLIKAAGVYKIADDIYRQVPYLLHAPIGAILVQEELRIADVEIIQAIGSHTLGRAFMADLEKVVFLADMIENDRNYPGVERLREMAGQNLDQAMLLGLDLTLKFCLDKKSLIHPQTVLTRNYFLNVNRAV